MIMGDIGVRARRGESEPFVMHELHKDVTSSIQVAVDEEGASNAFECPVI